MRNHIGDDIELMADANEAWRVDQALKASNELANFNLTWLEEPITPDDFRGYAYLKNNGATPIAAGENLTYFKRISTIILSQWCRLPRTRLYYLWRFYTIYENC